MSKTKPKSRTFWALENKNFIGLLACGDFAEEHKTIKEVRQERQARAFPELWNIVRVTVETRSKP